MVFFCLFLWPSWDVLNSGSKFTVGLEKWQWGSRKVWEEKGNMIGFAGAAAYVTCGSLAKNIANFASVWKRHP
jgi:hypothetical protein